MAETNSSTPQHTPGPWYWKINRKAKHLELVGRSRLTILQPIRWGMGSASLFVRDTSDNGLQLLHKLHERPDWLAPFLGREHHADWCIGVSHPDLRLIEAAPDLLAALRAVLALAEQHVFDPILHEREAMASARAAIVKATGGER